LSFQVQQLVGGIIILGSYIQAMEELFVQAGSRRCHMLQIAKHAAGNKQVKNFGIE